jgi:predicted regulator of amino acid metabolism with ACT domain
MSKAEMEKVIGENYPEDKEILKDLIRLGLRIKDSSLKHKIESLIKDIDKPHNKEIIIQETAKIFYSYFSHIKSLIENSEESEIKKITYVDNKEKFEKIFKNINPAKLEILKHCDGKNSIEDITQKVSMKESSIRSYISRMKNEKLITDSKKPLRLIDEIVINFS